MIACDVASPKWISSENGERPSMNKKPDNAPQPPDRYSRQERFAPLGVAGQQRLANASVAIVGCGALGTYHAAALARAGVGRLRIIDRDYVEWNNLQRQWLFEEADAE